MIVVITTAMTTRRDDRRSPNRATNHPIKSAPKAKPGTRNRPIAIQSPPTITA